MKKRFLSAALLALLAVGSFSFAACDQNSSSGDYSLTITNKAELQKEWPIGEPNRSLSVTLEPTANASSEVATGNLVVTSSNPSVVATTGLSLTAVGIGSATITASWHGASDSVDVAIVANTYDYSIAEINAGLKAGTIKDGDTVSFYGQFSASYEANSTHLGSGVFLGDGDDALMLYSGQLTSYFLADDGSLAIPYGTNVGVSAEVSAYNGFFEFKPSYVEVLDASYDIKTPTVLEITESNWGSIAFTDVGRLAKAELTYVSGTVSTASSTHSTITCKIGETEVLYYVNHHIGTDGVAAMADVINNLDAGDTFTSYGYINWYSDTPELTPAFVYVDGKVLTPGEGIEAPEKEAPTALSVTTADGTTGTASLPSNKTLQLSVSVTPDGADRRVTWTSSNESIATVSSAGLVSPVAKSDTPVTITATSVTNTTVSGSISVTVTDLKYDVAPYTMDTAYFLGYQKNDGTYRYYNGGVQNSYYGDVSSNIGDAVKVTINSSGSFYTLQLENEKYLGFEYASGHANFKWDLTTAYAWEYVADYQTFVAYTDEGEAWCLGTSTSYDEITMIRLSAAASSYPATLYEIPSDWTGTVIPDMELATSLTSGGQYYLSYPGSSDDVIYYFDGGTYSNNYLTASKSFSEAVLVTATGSDIDGWTLTFTKDGTEYTLYAWKNNTYNEIGIVESSSLASTSGAVSLFCWDTTYNGVTITVDGTKCGLFRNTNSSYYHEAGLYAYSNAETYTWVNFYSVVEAQ